MAFLRNHNREKFTVIDNTAIRDENLSLKAVGLLTCLLSMPDNWEFSENGLDTVFKKDGRASIRSGIKELEDNGYLHRSKVRDESGRITRAEWVVSENPLFDFPTLDNPTLENQPQLNTNTIKDLPNKEPTKEIKRWQKPTIEEIAGYCKERSNDIDPERFYDYYESNGWIVGKSHMKDWKATIRNWERNAKKREGNVFMDMAKEELF